jgi:hypothetical protein
MHVVFNAEPAERQSEATVVVLIPRKSDCGP